MKVTLAQVRDYRNKYTEKSISFLEIRTATGLSASGVEFLLNGRTFKKAGGTLTKSFAQVTIMFPAEEKKRKTWLKEYNTAYRKKRAADHKTKALAMLGGKCVKCGSTENLEFDHIEPSTKIFHILQQITGNWERIEKEVRKCQLLCYSCHKKKSAKEASAFNAIAFAGERSVHAKLTNEQVADYRQRFAAGEFTMTDLAEEVGMATKNVRLMLRGLTYTKAGGPLASALDAINYVAPHRKGPYKAEVARLYKSGVTSMGAIAMEVPVSAHTVKTYLIEAGLLEFGQKLSKSNQPGSKMTQEQARKYREVFANGDITRKTIAKETGLSKNGISRFLRGQSYRDAGGPLVT